MMTTTEVWAQLPQWLELPEEVQTSFAQYDAQYTPQVDDALRSRLLCRNTWDDALAELRHRLDPDPTGLRMLWELLHVACGTYARYVERGISQEIFVETMKFCTPLPPHLLPGARVLSLCLGLVVPAAAGHAGISGRLPGI